MRQQGSDESNPEQRFNVQQEERRELSMNHSMVTSNYNFSNSYEELLKQFKNYDTNKIDIKALHQSNKLKLKKYKEAVYYGEYQQGKRQGIGIMVYNSGQTYQGLWKNDNRHGHGYQKFMNGCVYEGNYQNGKMQGLGKYIWPNGQFYEGQWAMNSKNGTGMWRSEKGDTYVGEWRDGQAEGFGVFTEASGSRYQGQFLNFMKHGQGTQKFERGDLYKGQYKNGKFDGYGEYCWKDGSYYKGHFKQGVRSGHGLWKKGVGHSDKYEGQFLNNKKQGYGIYTWSNGHIYKGNYMNNLRHGYGEMYWSQGSFFKGSWQHDRQNGEGEVFDGDQSLTKGIFRDGSLVETTIQQFLPRRSGFQSGSNNQSSDRYETHERNYCQTPIDRLSKGSIPITKNRNRSKKNQFIVTSHFNTIEEARPVKIIKTKDINPLVRDSFLRKKLMETIGMKRDHKAYSIGHSPDMKKKSQKKTNARQKMPHSAFQIHRLHRNKIQNETPYDPSIKTSDGLMKFAFRGRQNAEHSRYYSRLN